MTKRDTLGWVGQVIDAKYRVDRAVDEGAFGIVYQAYHLKFDEKVALKCLKLPAGLRGERHEAFCRRFVAEGRFLHRLSRVNANVVQALDVGAEPVEGGEPVPYLVLEWLDGVSLADDLAGRAARGEGGRGLMAAIALLEPAVLALAAAHEQSVAHCDVKPANLYLTEVAGRPTLKVLDFGIARFTDRPTDREPDAEADDAFSAFSPHYAAPEQFDPSRGPAGPAADVFSLALVLVEVASGRTALEGRGVGDLFCAALDEANRPTLRARGVDCPAAVDEVVRQALSPRPEGRFATAFEFWQALRIAAGLPELERDDVASPGLVKTITAAPAASATPASAPEGYEPAPNDAPALPDHGAHAAPRVKRGWQNEKVRSLAAMAAGAALALAATHGAAAPGASPTPPLQSLASFASQLGGSTAVELGRRLLSRSDASPQPAHWLSSPAWSERLTALLKGGTPAAPSSVYAPAGPEGEADDASSFGLRAAIVPTAPDCFGPACEGGNDSAIACAEARESLTRDPHLPLGVCDERAARPHTRKIASASPRHDSVCPGRARLACTLR
jgi:eukaryotic-like serine/threonine-protein kinase